MFVSKKKFEELERRLNRYEAELKEWKVDRTRKVEEIARLLKYDRQYNPYCFSMEPSTVSIDLGSHKRTCLVYPSKKESYELTETPIAKGKKK